MLKNNKQDLRWGLICLQTKCSEHACSWPRILWWRWKIQFIKYWNPNKNTKQNPLHCHACIYLERQFLFATVTSWSLCVWYFHSLLTVIYNVLNCTTAFLQFPKMYGYNVVNRYSPVLSITSSPTIYSIWVYSLRSPKNVFYFKRHCHQGRHSKTGQRLPWQISETGPI